MQAHGTQFGSRLLETESDWYLPRRSIAVDPRRAIEASTGIRLR